MNPFKVLEVPDNSDIAICKASFRKLMRKYHPDLGGDVAKATELTTAWEMVQNGYKVVKTPPTAKPVYKSTAKAKYTHKSIFEVVPIQP